jgi:hypothetical protein
MGQDHYELRIVVVAAAGARGKKLLWSVLPSANSLGRSGLTVWRSFRIRAAEIRIVG